MIVILILRGKGIVVCCRFGGYKSVKCSYGFVDGVSKSELFFFLQNYFTVLKILFLLAYVHIAIYYSPCANKKVTDDILFYALMFS